MAWVRMYNGKQRHHVLLKCKSVEGQLQVRVEVDVMESGIMDIASKSE